MSLPDESSPLPEVPRQRLVHLLRQGVSIRSLALMQLSLLGTLYTLYFARAVILPIVLATIISFLLTPIPRMLNRRLHIPGHLGSALALGGLLLILAMGASFVVEPASAWIKAVPTKLPELKYRLEKLKSPFKKVTEASQQVEDMAQVMSPAPEQTVRMQSSGPASFVMTQTPALVTNIVVMFVLVYFMLASGDLFLRKLVHVVPSFQDKRRAVEIAREIQSRISVYLRTVTLINLGLGISIGACSYFVGLGNYVLWGAIAFVLNFIPYLGALVGISLTFVVGLLTFESTAYAFLMPALYLLIAVAEGNFLTPLILGRILTLNPVLVFISIMFWGWIWGVAGALLAVPILAIFKIVCDRLEPLTPLGEFIGGE